MSQNNISGRRRRAEKRPSRANRCFFGADPSAGIPSAVGASAVVSVDMTGAIEVARGSVRSRLKVNGIRGAAPAGRSSYRCRASHMAVYPHP